MAGDEWWAAPSSRAAPNGPEATPVAVPARHRCRPTPGGLLRQEQRGLTKTASIALLAIQETAGVSHANVPSYCSTPPSRPGPGRGSRAARACVFGEFREWGIAADAPRCGEGVAGTATRRRQCRHPGNNLVKSHAPKVNADVCGRIPQWWSSEHLIWGTGAHSENSRAIGPKGSHRYTDHPAGRCPVMSPRVSSGARHTKTDRNSKR
jgi:hypothetical protein